MKLNVIVKANTKENKIECIDDIYYVYTKSPAKEGKANDSVIALLSEYLNISRSNINIKMGLKSKRKIVEII